MSLVIPTVKSLLQGLESKPKQLVTRIDKDFHLKLTKSSERLEEYETRTIPQ